MTFESSGNEATAASSVTGADATLRRLYIAGPMSGIPDNNYPAFFDAARRLRAMRLNVENPAENPVPPCKSWLGYMRLSLLQIARVDGVVMLPGWQRSKGARAEHQLARNLGLPIWTLAQALAGEIR